HLLALAGLVTLAAALAVALATRGAGDRAGRTVQVALGVGLLAALVGTALAVATAGHAAV
ncbi:MAG TPA: hypothetical protein VGO78_09600, partial [Acidimicrobiales bacterium]|nr:hypothetical protein [Acidimicrobiales bacterium]